MPAPSQNPFAPPGANLSDHPDGRPGSPVKAVLVGFAADIGGTTAVTGILGIAYSFSLVAQGLPEQEIAAALTEISLDSWYSVVSLAIGLLFSALGGYVCARIARRAEYRLGAILGALSGLFGLVVGADHYSLATNVMLNIATIGCILIGAWYGRARNQRPDSQED